jgi:CubicO group peptidase (beta-lactamase class C family)
MEKVVPETLGLDSERLGRINRAMQGYVDQGRLSGAITIVARRGEIAHAECVGWMDLEAKKPVRLDTLYPIFSMTKPVTSVALMMLYEEGLFHLFDPVSKFIPEFKELQVYVKTVEGTPEFTSPEREITIHDLLTHTAGLVSDFWLDPSLTKLVKEAGLDQPDLSLQEFTNRLSKLPLIHQPGEAWRYGEAYEVVARLVEVISNQPFAAFLKQRIFEPLGMHDTGFGIPEGQQDRLVKYYGFSEAGGLVEALEENPRWRPSSIPRGGIGLVSTASDYLRFAQMLLNGGELDGVRLLGRKTVQYMTRNHLPQALLPPQVAPGWEVPGYGYGLGFGVVTDAVQCKVMGSEGQYYWDGIEGTWFWIDPKEELIGLIMLRMEPWTWMPVCFAFQVLMYQAIVD